MIHEVLHLTRRLIILDTETTGVDDSARILELGFQVWDATGLVKEWKSLIHPGLPIPPAATAVHGITDERLTRCQLCAQAREQHPVDGCEIFHGIPRFHQIAESLARGFTDCDFAGKFVRFDLGRVAFEMQRAHVPWSYAGARIIDIDRLEQIAVPRTLSDLYQQ